MLCSKWSPCPWALLSCCDTGLFSLSPQGPLHPCYRGGYRGPGRLSLGPRSSVQEPPSLPASLKEVPTEKRGTRPLSQGRRNYKKSSQKHLVQKNIFKIVNAKNTRKDSKLLNFVIGSLHSKCIKTIYLHSVKMNNSLNHFLPQLNF